MADFDPNKDSTFIMYLDANNLYGYAMMQPLPLNGFEWCDAATQFDAARILALDDDAPVGYIFEVDLFYPPELHNKHADYPFCCEKVPVPDSSGHIEKLLLTLSSKTNYVIHYQMLKMALSHGLVLTNIHRVLTFNQSRWLKPYIELKRQCER